MHILFWYNIIIYLFFTYLSRTINVLCFTISWLSFDTEQAFIQGGKVFVRNIGGFGTSTNIAEFWLLKMGYNPVKIRKKEDTRKYTFYFSLLSSWNQISLINPSNMFINTLGMALSSVVTIKIRSKLYKSSPHNYCAEGQ